MENSLRNWCTINNRLDLVEQWDTERNAELGLTLDSVAPKVSKKAFWKCPDYLDHIYDMRINQRTRQGQGCPYCKGKRVLKGFNDLATKCKDAEKEWDYENNWDEKKKRYTTPSDYSFGSKYVANFKCSVCKEKYSMMIKTFNKGNRCKYCAHCEARPDGSNSFAKEHPDQLKFWDYEKNDKITTKRHPNGVRPDAILSKSNIRVYWKCGFGHTWKISVDSQVGSPGCSKCNRRKKFSDSEKTVAYYVEKMFPGGVMDNHHPDWNRRQDLDVYLPSESIAIQYDGSYKHDQSRVSIDQKNGKQVLAHGIKLFRIRERECPPIEDGSTIIIRDGTGRHAESLNECVTSLLDQLSEITGRTYDFTVDCDRDFSNIVERSYTVELNNSISKIRPDVVQYIASNDEHPQDREVLSRLPAAHNGKIWWTCPRCGLDHYIDIHSVTQKSPGKFPCKILNNSEVVEGINDFATTNPEEMKDWDWVNNSANGFNPKKLAAGSNQGPISWVCHKPKCGFSWTTEHLYERTGNQAHGCPQCYERRRKDRSRNNHAKYTIQYLVLIRDNPKITAKKIQESLGTTIVATKSKLGEMVKIGEITYETVKVSKGPKSFAYSITDKGQAILDRLTDEEIAKLSEIDISKKAPKKNINDLPTWCASHNRMTLLDEWHPDNPNGPENYRASDGDLVKWICHVCKYVWTCSIDSRTLSNHDCDECHRRTTKVTLLLCLRAVRDRPGITAKQLTDAWKKPLVLTSKKLKQLTDEGQLKRERIGKNYAYTITDKGMKEIELSSKLGMDIGPFEPSNEQNISDE